MKQMNDVSHSRGLQKVRPIATNVNMRKIWKF